MRVRPVNVFGQPVPGGAARTVVGVGQGASRIEISAPGHLPRFRIVFDSQLESDDELTITLLMDPATIIADLPPERACYLNLLAKMSTVPVAGRPLSGWLSDEEPHLLESDRSYLLVGAGLHDAMDGAAAFNSAPGGLHESPDGFERAGSWKTAADKRAGLQLVLHRGDSTWIGEFDIDLRTGVAHWFEALGNEITNSTTNPYIVAQMLVQQGIDPGHAFAAGT